MATIEREDNQQIGSRGKQPFARTQSNNLVNGVISVPAISTAPRPTRTPSYTPQLPPDHLVLQRCGRTPAAGVTAYRRTTADMHAAADLSAQAYQP